MSEEEMAAVVTEGAEIPGTEGAEAVAEAAEVIATVTVTTVTVTTATVTTATRTTDRISGKTCALSKGHWGVKESAMARLALMPQSIGRGREALTSAQL